MDLKHVIPQQRRRTYGPSFDIAFSTDKSNVSRVGPNPVFSRASSGTFVNENGRIVGKTRSTTSLNPASVPVGGVAVFAVPSGSVVGWLNNSVVSVMEDTDGDDQIGAQRHVTGTLIHKTDTAITLLVTSKSGTTTLSSWFVSYRGLRNDHNPATGLCLGALIEESRTNNVTQSGSMNLWTGAGGSTRAVSTVDSPDGNKATIGTSGGSSFGGIIARSISSFTSTIGTQYTASCFIKKDNWRYVSIDFAALRPAGPTVPFFDLDTLTFNANGSTTTGLITSYPNGWYRLAVSGAATSAISTVIDIILTTSTGVTNASVGGLVAYIWGAQLEAGPAATSYIPTTAAATIRSADVYGVSGTDFSRFYNQPEGTLFASGIVDTVGVGILFPTFLNLNDGTANNRIVLGSTNSGGAAVRPIIANSGSTIYNQSIGTVSAGQSRKVALAYKASGFMAAANSQLATAGTTGSPPSGLNRADINSSFFVGTISAIRYYHNRLSNTQLQALTATISEPIVYNGVAIWYNGVGLIETN